MKSDSLARRNFNQSGVWVLKLTRTKSLVATFDLQLRFETSVLPSHPQPSFTLRLKRRIPSIMADKNITRRRITKDNLTQETRSYIKDEDGDEDVRESVADPSTRRRGFNLLDIFKAIIVT